MQLALATIVHFSRIQYIKLTSNLLTLQVFSGYGYKENHQFSNGVTTRSFIGYFEFRAWGL